MMKFIQKFSLVATASLKLMAIGFTLATSKKQGTGRRQIKDRHLLKRSIFLRFPRPMRASASLQIKSPKSRAQPPYPIVRQPSDLNHVVPTDKAIFTALAKLQHALPATQFLQLLKPALHS